MSDAKVVKKFPWTTDVENVTNSLPVRMRKEKKKTKIIILHQKFADCAELTKDPFWKKIYQQSARGKFPRGFLYDEESSILTYRYNNKVKDLLLEGSPEEMLLISLAFFKDEGNIRSPSDIEKETMELNDLNSKLSNFQIHEWSEIRQKTTKVSYIIQYANKIAKEHNLDEEEKCKLISWINWGIEIRVITTKDIVIVNGSIEKINGIYIDGKTFGIEEDHLVYKTKSKPKITNEVGKLVKDWNKILREISGKSKSDDQTSTVDGSTTVE